MRLTVPALDPATGPTTAPRVTPAAQRISNRNLWRLFFTGLVISDALMVGLAFRLAYFTRFELTIPAFQLDVTPSIEYYQSLVVILIPLWVLIFAANGLYQRHNLLGGTREYAKLFNSISIGTLVVILTSFFEPGIILSRGWLLMAWAFAFFLTSLARFTIRRIVYRMRNRGYFLAPTLVVGANQEGQLIADQLTLSPAAGLHLVGFVDDTTPPGTPLFHHLPVLGSVDRLDELIKKHHVEEVIIATSAISRDMMVSVFKDYGFSKDVNLRLSSGLFEIVTTSLQVKELGFVPLVTVNKVRMTGLDQAMKYMLDYCLTIAGLIAIAPLLTLIALLIKLDSPGPVLHRRRVMGVNGSQFDAYKFRTMYTNGDEILASRPDLQAELARNHKLKNDPRVTRVGRWLRKFSLDELPQLFNVLRGQMSLVGPRMISPEEMENYNQWGFNLLTVRPGLTGLWQVSGRSDLSYKDRVRLDMYYIRNWTIWLDLQLLWQTIPVVLKGRGAY